MCFYVRTKFQVSSVILTSLRQGVNLFPPPQDEPLKSPPRLGLIHISTYIDSNIYLHISINELHN